MGHQEIRIPPQNVEAEKSVLGSMLIDEEAIGTAIESLDEMWFYDDAHRQIYKAMVGLYQSRKNVDLITLSDKLKNDGLLEQIGGDGAAMATISCSWGFPALGQSFESFLFH